jgi:hypothetical protein
VRHGATKSRGRRLGAPGIPRTSLHAYSELVRGWRPWPGLRRRRQEAAEPKPGEPVSAGAGSIPGKLTRTYVCLHCKASARGQQPWAPKLLRHAYRPLGDSRDWRLHSTIC